MATAYDSEERRAKLILMGHFAEITGTRGKEGAVHLGFRSLDADAFRRIVLQLSRERVRTQPPRKCRKTDPNSVENILKNLPHMPYYLNVVGNPVGDKGMKSLQHLPSSIVDLDLSDTKMTAEGAQLLFKYMETNTSVTRLIMWGNEGIGGGAACSLHGMLCNNSTLQILCCSDCGMGAISAATIAHSLIHNPTLRELDIGENPIFNCQVLCEKFFVFLGKNKGLQVLQMGAPGGIDAPDYAVKSLTKCLRKNTSLHTLVSFRTMLDRTDWPVEDADDLTIEAKYLLTMNRLNCRNTISPTEPVEKVIEKLVDGRNEVNILYHVVRHYPHVVVVALN